MTREYVVDGEELHPRVTVTNAAEPTDGEDYATASTFAVEVHRDGQLVERTRTDEELEPGETDEVSLGSWTADAGDHELTVRVDVHDEVAETDETDNRASRTVHVVEQADPSVVDVTVREPVLPWSGHEVRVEVANVGEGPMLAAASLAVEVCPEQPSPTSGCEQLPAAGAVSLEPGQSHVAETTWNAQGSVGAFQVRAYLDYELVQEATVNDDACASTYAVAAAGPVGGLQTG